MSLSSTLYIAHRYLTEDEIIFQGLSTGSDAPLEVREGGCAGCGVFATGHISMDVRVKKTSTVRWRGMSSMT